MRRRVTRRIAHANDRRRAPFPAPHERRSKDVPLSHSDAVPVPAAAAPGGPLSGRVKVPGDKSISHRAMIFGLLAIGETEIEGLLEGEDVLRTAEAARALGARLEHRGARLRGRGSHHA